MIHQPQYKFLEREQGPQVIVQLVRTWGTREIVGPQHNPVIMRWAKEVGLERTYTADEIPWCGLLAAVVVQRANFTPVTNPLWARNWVNFGNPVPKGQEMLGDILVFTRPGGGGHVGFYLGEDATCFHVGGGNQSNMVNGTRILKSRLIQARRCPWRIAQPTQVRKITLNANGTISNNEQ